ncbi:MAG: hypothetical protein U1F57_05255 [bacterium]
MKTKISVSFFFLLFLIGSSQGLWAGDITPAARKMIGAVDQLNVEQNWPAGVHVDWETGVPDGKPEKTEGKHTHCSAFVASAAKHLGVYILRPPEHGQVLLANAQYDWLAEEGAKNGWKALSDGIEAQKYANQGYLVVASYKNHHDDKPGHIAIVRPSDKSVSDIKKEGPEITQAGGTNYRSTSLKQGFSGHPAAWDKNEVKYYAHAVEAGSKKH